MKRAFRRLLLATTLACAPLALAWAQDCTADAGSTGIASAGFHIANEQIVDPSGKVFVAKGINLSAEQIGDADTVIALFPGVNFIRVPVTQYNDPGTFAAFVQKMTARGTVVEFEDHHTSDGSDSGGSQGVVFTGQLLATELAWYSAMGKAFAGNPYVWFGTNNEPAVNGGSVSQWDVSIYQAIRGAGNASILMVEAWIWYGLNPSDFASMTNIVWDPHFYTQSTPETSDAVEAAMEQRFNEVTAIKTADGTAPVIFGEFGPETDMWMGMVAQMINDVSAGKWGAAAWWWGSGGTWLDLQENGQVTSPYGQMVQLWIGNDISPPSACAVSAGATAAIAAATKTALASPVPVVSGDDPASADAVTAPAATLAALPVTGGSATDDSTEGLQAQITALQAEVAALEANARDTGPLGASAKVTPGVGSVLNPAGGGPLTITQSGSIMLGNEYVAGGGGTAALVVVQDTVYGLDDSGKGWFTYDPVAKVWTSSAAPAGT